MKTAKFKPIKGWASVDIATGRVWDVTLGGRPLMTWPRNDRAVRVEIRELPKRRKR